ncbi:MAG: M20 metallopeptidase family protein [Brevinema sp.]
MYKDQIAQIKQWLIEVRRDFHQYPELGYEEYRTSKKIQEYLEEIGLKPRIIAKTGVVADIFGEDSHITIALRADMDALPIYDQKQCPYASKNPGMMHACGHDAHMTILLGVARILSQSRPPCNIRLMFQPAEETDGGALPMIEEGVLEGVQGVLGLHVDSELPIGQIAIKYGAMNASSDMITIELFGKKGHGAYPSEGVDAVVMAASVIQNLQTIISRNIDGRSSAVLSLGMIHGGTARNIIADYIKIEGTIRTLDPDLREYINTRAEEIVISTAKMFGGKGKYLRKYGYTSLINYDRVVDLIRESGEMILGEKNVLIKAQANMGVEDFAYFVQQCEGAFFYLGTANQEKNIMSGGHTENFDIDEDALLIGIEIQLQNIHNYYALLNNK